MMHPPHGFLAPKGPSKLPAPPVPPLPVRATLFPCFGFAKDWLSHSGQLNVNPISQTKCSLFIWIMDHDINRTPLTKWGFSGMVWQRRPAFLSPPLSPPPPSFSINLPVKQLSKMLPTYKKYKKVLLCNGLLFNIYLCILCVWCFVCIYAHQKRALDPVGLPL